MDLQDIELLAAKDLKEAAQKLTVGEARYLVDFYYQIQDFRKATANQIRSLGDNEPSNLITGVFGSMERVENRIKKGLDYYTDIQLMGAWAKSIVGIGPIIAAGLLAHIDLNKCRTAGAIWRFAGLDPTVRATKKDAAEKWIKDKLTSLDNLNAVAVEASTEFGRSANTLVTLATTDNKGKAKAFTSNSLASAIARRPWNGSLKTLCWKIGESFVKVSGNPESLYGRLYLQRKALEWQYNQQGRYKEQAERKLATTKIGKTTDAYIWYAGRLTVDAAREILSAPSEKRESLTKKLAKDAGIGIPMLPPGHINERAKRWVVKLFLAHYFEEGCRRILGKEPPTCYSIAMLGHAHYIAAEK